MMFCWLSSVLVYAFWFCTVLHWMFSLCHFIRL
jgi:hypothetical protein